MNSDVVGEVVVDIIEQHFYWNAPRLQFIFWFLAEEHIQEWSNHRERKKWKNNWKHVEENVEGNIRFVILNVAQKPEVVFHAANINEERQLFIVLTEYANSFRLRGKNRQSVILFLSSRNGQHTAGKIF